MKYGQNLKLRDVPVTPINIQEVQASKLGDAPGIPSSSTKYQVIFHLLYFYCFICYVLFLECLRFLFSVFFCFVLFSVINAWITTFLCGKETHSTSLHHILLWGETRSVVLHHIYFGVRHAPLFCIIFTLG